MGCILYVKEPKQGVGQAITIRRCGRQELSGFSVIVASVTALQASTTDCI
jgi:hypothetical protein